MKRNTQLCFILMLISVGAVRSVQQKFSLTKISALTSRIPGSGMDQGISIFGYDSGGSYSLVICQGDECCATGKLNTEDDNWELGQVDWFVGRQIGDCQGMELDPEGEVRLVLQHEGSNAGLLDWVRLHSWSDWEKWECEVRVRLDYSNSYSTLCQHSPSNLLPGQVCNGRTEFCQMRFDQFLFPGSHNAGTGQRKGSFACAFKNQDLNIEEQLEFGIRFFDIDIILSHSHGCDGLETGHGRHPDLGLYQCYGKLSSLLTSLRTWLDNHPSEVVTLNFGNIEYPDSTIPELQKTMNELFPTNSSGVKMNGQFKSVLAWPTLGECVRSNERIFVFVRDTVGLLAADSQSFVKEIKVKPELLFSSNLTVGEGEVTIMTSYQAEDVEGDCAYILESNKEACTLDNVAGTDFLKLSFFSKFGESGTFGTECLHQMAKKCNVWPLEAVRKCTERRFRPNFILLDYPNYQGNAKTNIVQLCNQVNLERAQQIEG